ncbi:MAG TPA: ATP-grasp domain-containing protein [Pyrinomonadaceae bacterium]|nr:ATP-grasp domain-containing protein [Pyrinomonadaceae bacterium]
MSDSTSAPTILCIASFSKGNDFIREAAAQGARVVLLTREKLLGEDWARESLDELLAIPGKTSVSAYLMAATHVARTRRVTRVVALEEYDIVTAAHIREHLCVAGLGTTTARCFQDKLAMRAKGRALGLPQPEFVQLLNYEAIDEFMKANASPWMLKPRIGASSMGMRRLSEPEEVRSAIRELDRREALHERSDFHLLEKYEPGNVYHVDSLIVAGEIVFTNVAQYGAPPFDIARGGVNTSGTVPYKSKTRKDLLALNARLLQGFGIDRGVTHAEFIERSDAKRAQDRFYFLEVAARVGGAFTAETIEAATGINFWREWAKIEAATKEKPYRLPKTRKEYGGIAMSLARQESPDTSAYDDAEIVLRVVKPNHVGLIIRSKRHQRMIELLDQYVARFHHDFTAVVPVEERAEQHL